ncbi:MAG: hypothetical protein LC689_10065 [Myxococcales bacterium]|nr:hypothetical protein [Myxococcales bacterium]
MFALLLAAAADAGTPVPIAPLQTAPDIVPLVPPPPEYTLELKDARWRVHVNFRPGEPQPGEVVELTFDVGRQKDGDEPAPWSDGKLALTVTGPGPRTRYLVRALGDAGVYGVHWTPFSRGLWTLALAPYEDQGPSVSFQVGAGEPMPISSQGHMVQASRVVVGARESGQPSVKALMADLGKRWQRQIASPIPDPAELKAMEKLLRAIEKRGNGPEFDALAEHEATALERSTVPDAASCLECHLKFRDHWK